MVYRHRPGGCKKKIFLQNSFCRRFANPADRCQAPSVSTSKDVVDLKWVEKWNGILPQMMGGNAMIPMVNFGK